MAKQLILLIAIIGLTGCPEHYVKPTHYEETVIITWSRTDDANYDCGGTIRDNILGCAGWQRLSKEEAVEQVKEVYDKQGYILGCEILSPQVRYNGDDNMMTLGHEANHCFTGSFHN
jgi:hypothetical protein